MPRGRIRSSLAAAVAATTLLLLIPTAGQAQSTTRTACPGTFQVLHNDSIGTLRLSAGAYQITVANPAALSCARAAQDLAEFLQDYDGKLRRPWNVNTRAVAFQRGSDGQVAFSLARVGSATPGGGGGVVPTPTANACPGFFNVLHNDHIGSLSVPKDAYRITLLSPSALGCASGLAPVHLLPPGLRRHAALAVGPEPDHRHVHAPRLEHRLPHQAGRRSPSPGPAAAAATRHGASPASAPAPSAC